MQNPVPFIKTNWIDFYPINTGNHLNIPFFDSAIQAGFPSPAGDFLESAIDFNKILFKNKASTFAGRVKGYSMRDAGIDDGDILIVDKSLEAANDKIAVCVIDGEFTLKRLSVVGKEIWLMPENKDFKPIKISDYHNFEIWGVVTFSIKSHLKCLP